MADKLKIGVKVRYWNSGAGYAIPGDGRHEGFDIAGGEIGLVTESGMPPLVPPLVWFGDAKSVRVATSYLSIVHDIPEDLTDPEAVEAWLNT